MTKNNLLIVGSGGYIACVVLPVLKKHFSDINITLFSRTPGNLVTLAERENIGYLKSWDQSADFSHVLLACPPEDFLGYLVKFQNPSTNIWLEKPLVDLDDQQFFDLNKWSKTHTGKIWAGFNKRLILKNFDLKSENNVIEVDFHVDISGGWRDQLSKGGSLWLDGIHALDFAQQLLPNSKCKCLVKEKDLWIVEFTSPKGKAIVRIGNTKNNSIAVNGISNADFTSNSRSKEYFAWNFKQFIDGSQVTNFSFDQLRSLMDCLSTETTQHLTTHL